jgi:hypothetical protein
LSVSRFLAANAGLRILPSACRSWPDWRGAGGSDPPPDKKQRDVNGQNYNHDWWVLSAKGVPIKKNAR